MRVRGGLPGNLAERPDSDGAVAQDVDVAGGVKLLVDIATGDDVAEPPKTTHLPPAAWRSMSSLRG